MKKYTPVTIQKKCYYCNSLYSKSRNRSLSSWDKSKFCSNLCTNKANKGHSAWNKGIKIDKERYPKMGHFNKHTEESKRKMREAIVNWEKTQTKEELYKLRVLGQKRSIEVGKLRGSYKGTLGRIKELNSSWKDNEASYSSKHKWIQKHWTKTGICQECKEKPLPYGNRKFGTEWHNIDNNYDRNNKKYWIELCKTCHNIADKLLKK
jgi:hypothetical protein